jgi:serine/threonine-protein kinase RsbW
MEAFSYTFPGMYASLSEIAGVIKEKSLEAGLSETAINAVECAVDEACSNIIEHAYGGEGKGEIYLNIEINREGIKIMITDHGKSFRPEDVLAPDIQAPLSDRNSSGLGLYMMKKCMNVVSFDFQEGCNTLTMVKFKNSSS